MVIIDKDWAERAALALPAHMNLTGLMIEIDLAKNRKGNESQKSNSIKNELKKKKRINGLPLLPLLSHSFPSPSDTNQSKSHYMGPSKFGVCSRAVEP